MAAMCRSLAALAAAIWAVCLPLPGAANTDFVDLELVLAVDVSMSMDPDEQHLQRDGYVAAFRDPELLRAIRKGPNGRIAVTYVEWAGNGIQTVVVPWHVVGSADEANGFADALDSRPVSRALYTSISGATSSAHMLFAASPVRGLRRVIDISGDGPNNSGVPVEVARDRVVAEGTVVNGLAIQLGDRRGPYTYFDLPDLDRYYHDCVIGGPGAFVLSIRAMHEFATAIRKKLLLEIAGRAPSPPQAKVIRAQHSPGEEKYDCLIGEKMLRQYRRDDTW